MSVKFKATPAELRIIKRIGRRAAVLMRRHGSSQNYGAIRLSVIISLVVTHSNGCPLDLERMVKADDFNLLHDVDGINRYLNTETGRLTQCFLPRFAKRECVV
ncbi:hypothetical protein NKW54_05460 [Acetobacter cerevisiae]|uniref:DUF6874 domain-containing protein n=1 Tax=Acetobacter cerevisiae TaxID=178900 RepID=A0ABT1EPT2_9PROT|nr:hypothetical protein [Acetobacter cerevisiae]MCP1245388.1 hypothetical protein [Acetobacter cerevisiae]MCP1254964.1 hypothetical protein [Acetobacter cerevisiae]